MRNQLGQMMMEHRETFVDNRTIERTVARAVHARYGTTSILRSIVRS